MPISRPLAAILAAALLNIPGPLWAAEEISSANNNLATYTLPTITVEALQPTLSSEILLDRQLLESLPVGNGNLTDYLQTVPGIQFSDDFNSSKTGGEITPALISISGGRTEDNLFILDGVSISSQLDPNSTDTATTTHEELPGHPLTQFIMGSSLEQLKILRYDIPANYGGFNGGVVVGELKNPTDELSGEISLGMTRSCWGKFHIAAEDEDEFYNSEDEDNQPNFDKYQYNAYLSGALNDKVNAIISYSRLDSEIPLTLLGEEVNQERKNENLFVKTQITPRDDTEISITASYSPYQGDYFLEDTKNSDYSIIGGGYLLSTTLQRELTFGRIKASLSYQESYNNRTASDTYYLWKVTDSKPWGELADSSLSKEGGYGDLDTTQTDLEATLEYTTDTFSLGRSKHLATNGIQISQTRGTASRADDSITYMTSANTSVICSDNDDTCIDGEQYAIYKTLREEYSAETTYNSYTYYLDDSIDIGKLKLRPGLRFSYESLQQNLNMAPRLTAQSAPFGSNWPLLHAGWNRYYRDNLLTMYLDEQRPDTTTYIRYLDDDGNPEEWEFLRSSTNKNLVSELETPYVDEWSLGFSQNLLGGRFSADYINRHSEKQIITVWTEESDGITYKKWRNDGKTIYEELSLQWERRWKKYFLNMNVTWSESTTNSSSYASIYYEDELDYISYDGELMYRSELPADNYARPIKASLTASADLAHGFSLSGTANFRDRYKKLKDTNKDTDDGYAIYDVVSIPSAFTVDMQLAWEIQLRYKQQIQLTCDITNLLNKRIDDGSDDDDYLLGRQYWVGISYKF
jgi:hypothetical protein